MKLKTDLKFQTSAKNLTNTCNWIMSLDEYPEILNDELEWGSKSPVKDAILAIAVDDTLDYAKRWHHYEQAMGLSTRGLLHSK